MYTVEITDTYAGEANYSWRREYKVKAETVRGAMRVAARDFGGQWRKEYSAGDMARYNMLGACICAFITWADE